MRVCVSVCDRTRFDFATFHLSPELMVGKYDCKPRVRTVSSNSAVSTGFAVVFFSSCDKNDLFLCVRNVSSCFIRSRVSIQTHLPPSQLALPCARSALRRNDRTTMSYVPWRVRLLHCSKKHRMTCVCVYEPHRPIFDLICSAFPLNEYAAPPSDFHSHRSSSNGTELSSCRN